MWFYRTSHLGKCKSDDSGRKGTHRTRSRICADIKIKLVAPVRGRDHPTPSQLISVTGTRLDRIFLSTFWAPCIATQVICRRFINFLTEFQILISRFNYSFPFFYSSKGNVYRPNSRAQRFRSKASGLLKRPNNVQLGAGYKFQSEQESSRAVYVFRCRYLFEHAAARFSNIFATGLKIPPPKISIWYRYRSAN